MGLSAGMQLGFIQPGKPVENAFSESFNGRLQDEHLNVHQCARLLKSGPSSKRGGSITISVARIARSGTRPRLPDVVRQTRPGLPKKSSVALRTASERGQR